MSKRATFWYSLIMIFVCFGLAFAFLCWKYYKAVWPMILFGNMLGVPTYLSSNSKSKFSFSNVFSSLILTISTVIIVLLPSLVHIDEKEFLSPVFVVAMLVILAILLAILFVYGVVGLIKYKRKTLIDDEFNESD